MFSIQIELLFIHRRENTESLPMNHQRRWN